MEKGVLDSYTQKNLLLIPIKSNKIWIVITHFRWIQHQTAFHLVLSHPNLHLIICMNMNCNILDSYINPTVIYVYHITYIYPTVIQVPERQQHQSYFGQSDLYIYHIQIYEYIGSYTLCLPVRVRIAQEGTHQGYYKERIAKE